MAKAINKARVLQLLAEGWELGVSAGFSPRVWMQKNGLSRGGETEDVNWNSMHSLRDSGTVVRLPERDGDPYWMHRYGLPPTRDGDGGRGSE